jgi:hypothetical protein
LSHKQIRFAVHYGPDRTLRQRVLAAKARVSRNAARRDGFTDEIDDDAADPAGEATVGICGPTRR